MEVTILKSKDFLMQKILKLSQEVSSNDFKPKPKHVEKPENNLKIFKTDITQTVESKFQYWNWYQCIFAKFPEVQ